MQSKKMSIVEVIINVGLGFFLNLLIQIFLFPLFGVEITIMKNVFLTAIFTITSMIRGYIVRRLFDKYCK